MLYTQKTLESILDELNTSNGFSNLFLTHSSNSPMSSTRKAKKSFSNAQEYFEKNFNTFIEIMSNEYHGILPLYELDDNSMDEMSTQDCIDNLKELAKTINSILTKIFTALSVKKLSLSKEGQEKSNKIVSRLQTEINLRYSRNFLNSLYAIIDKNPESTNAESIKTAVVIYANTLPMEYRNDKICEALGVYNKENRTYIELFNMVAKDFDRKLLTFSQKNDNAPSDNSILIRHKIIAMLKQYKDKQISFFINQLPFISQQKICSELPITQFLFQLLENISKKSPEETFEDCIKKIPHKEFLAAAKIQEMADLLCFISALDYNSEDDYASTPSWSSYGSSSENEVVSPNSITNRSPSPSLKNIGFFERRTKNFTKDTKTLQVMFELENFVNNTL